jgi:MYXO-CTERM domain-containing protein
MLRSSLLVAVLFVALPAGASSTYPGAIKDHLTASKLPACTLCHQTAGGGGPVVTPFAHAMVAEGLTGGSNTTALTAALDALEAAGTDSDGDGTGDIDELRAGGDPNTAGASNAGPTPVYGFGCAAAPAASPLVGALAVLGLFALRRRR